MLRRNDLENIAADIVDAAYTVHRRFGPGLLESAYQTFMAHELRKRGHVVRVEVRLPLRFDELELEAGYRVDLLVDDVIIIENKAVQSLTQVHTAQVVTYLKLSGLKLGFLINWNVALIKNGIKRIANGLE